MDIVETSDCFEKVISCEKNVDNVSFETILLPEEPSDQHIPEEDQPSTTSLEEGELPSDELSKSSPPRSFGMSLDADSSELGSNFQLTLDAALRTPPRKPVLGKEKAKQRLKSLSIQKKIQMEGRNNVTPRSQKIKSSADMGPGSSTSSKRDKKFLSPHEKAQITINEIEVLKREEDAERPKVPICFHESMIHRITADSFDDSKPSTSQLSLTSSLEAIKSYDDDDNRGEERRRKLSKPEAYRRRRHSGTSPLTAKRSSKSKRRSSNRMGSRSEKKGSKSRRRSGERRRSKSSRRPHTEDREPRKFASYAVQVGSPGCDLFPESKAIRYTRAKPTITFCFSPSATKAHEEKEKSKALKRKKKKRGKKNLPIAPSAGEIKEVSQPVAKVKSKHKKKRRSSGSKESVSKSSKVKQEKLSQHKRPLLSFGVDDLNFEEEVDEFPLSKEGFQPSAESQDASRLKATIDQQAEGACKNDLLDVDLNGSKEDLFRSPPESCSLRAIDKSPDTDEYMPNWEEEDEEEDSSKDEISLSVDATKMNEESAVVADYTNSSADIAEDSSVDGSVKDGLGTPIFVNPSPPREIIEKSLRDSETDGGIEQHVAAAFTATADKNAVEDVEESLTPPPIRPKHLFEMENIYEQFLQSVREDPDFKDSASNAAIPADFADEIELRFGSQHSELLSPSSKTLASASPSSSFTEPSDSDESSDSVPSREQPVIETVPSAKRTRKKKKHRRRKRSVEEAGANDASDIDELASITPADFKKLRSLQKRRGMLKMVREQLDGMDEEDRQCLLGLEKLVRVERLMLLRNTALRKLHEQQNILGTDSEDDEKVEGANQIEKVNDANISSPPKSTTPPPQNCDGDIIFDANRETIKMTLTNNSPMKNLLTQSSKSGISTEASSGDEEQDFTERLMKSKETEEKSSASKSEGKDVVHRSEKRSRRSSRLLTSPSRHSRASPSRKKKSIRSKKVPRSPTPPRTISRRKSSQSRSRYTDSPVPSRLHRLPRSPIAHRASGSPTQSHSSSSRSRSRSTSPNSPALSSYSAWNINRYSQYYIGDSSYYYPRVVPGSDTDDKVDGSHRYPSSYHDYAHYNMYANEYMHTGYAEDYSHIPIYEEQHRAAPSEVSDSNSYLSIPVIGASTGASAENYFYSADSSKISVNVSKNNEILQQGDADGSAKVFAVQKGNVLEIVPAATITPAGTDESKGASTTKILETISEDENRQGKAVDSSSDSSEELKASSKVDGTKVNDAKVPASKKSHSSWKNEVARRHVVSAVMRLNKEAEESPRGILKNRGNSNLSNKERKKVLFADGVPPGRSSSASSDEETTLKLIKRQLKRKQRRLQSENKENEMFVEATDNLEAKIDPELWNALPPPPPPGSPPPHLPQPILIRPPSPEEALYFHFDPVFNMMYVSPMEDAIPPRLLQNNGKSMMKHGGDSTVGTENGDLGTENSIPDKLEPASPTRPASPVKKEDTINAVEDDSVPKPSISPEPQKPITTPPPQTTSQTTPQDPNNSTASIPVPSPRPASSPPRPIQNIVSMRMSNNSPLFSCTSPQAGMSPTTIPLYEPAQQQSPSQMQPTGPRPPIPVLVGYPGQMFGRMPSRRSSPRMMRGAYNMLAMPPPHGRAFNPHIPPPFTSPPPAANHNSSLPAVSFENPALNGFPRSPLSNSPQVPLQQFNPGMMMYGPQQPSRPPNFRYAGVAPPQAPPPPPVTLNPPPNRFPPNFPPPGPMMGFMHGPPDRNGSPHKLND